MTRRILLIAVIGLVLAAGLYFFMRRSEEPTASPTASGSAQPPPEVGVIVAQPAEVPYPEEFAGRVAGFRDVEVRPPCRRPPAQAGIRGRRHASHKVRSCSGSIQPPIRLPWTGRRRSCSRRRRRSARPRTTSTGPRSSSAAASRATCSSDADRSQRDQARASVSLAEAEVEGAKLNLGYTTVTAPAAGVTALESPPVGTLIQAQQTLLTIISQLDPAYVNFSFTDRAGPGLPGAQHAAREADHREGSDASSCSMRRRRSIPSAAGSTPPPSGSIRRPARSRRGPSSRTRTASCCRASSSGCGSSASRYRTPSSSRARR